MNIEDCEVGMTVECKSTKYDSINKGDKLTIAKVSQSYIYFEENYSSYLPKNFKPVNKFKIGDEVIYRGFKVKIFGVDSEGINYAIEFNDDEDFKCYLALERELSPLKNKDELEAGDKFKSGCDKYVILFKEYDVARSEIKYLLKDLNTGELLLRGTGNIDEIIYD